MRLLVTTALIALTLAACGGSEDSIAEAAAEAPACSDVWVVGETLPSDYENCVDDAGSLTLGIFYDCADGSELTTYGDETELFAFLGKEIQSGDDAYPKAFDDCNPN